MHRTDWRKPPLRSCSVKPLAVATKAPLPCTRRIWPLLNQLVHGASDCQACRAKLLGQLVFGRNHRARRVVRRARFAPQCSGEFVCKPASGFYCISHSITHLRSATPFCLAVIGKTDTWSAESRTCNTRQSASFSSRSMRSSCKTPACPPEHPATWPRRRSDALMEICSLAVRHMDIPLL